MKMSISAVILNFNRPDYIKNNIIPSLEKIETINEIIVSHGKKETIFDHPSIKSLDHTGTYNKEWGLSLRFLSGKEAKNDTIIIMDDDIIPAEKTVNFLNQNIEKDSKRIHGIYGRSFNSGDYEVTNVFGEVPIVLTRLLICKKEMCQYYVDNFRKYESELVKNSKPYWNGEDILFSLLSIQKYKNLPKAFNLSHENRIWNYINLKDSISLDSSHLNYRKDVSKYFLENIEGVKEIIKNKENISKTKNQFSYFLQNCNILLVLISFVTFIFLFYRVYI